jgi:hypothetical protein
MKLLIISAIAVAGVGYCSQPKADCYTRVSTNISQQAINSQPVDIQKLVSPDGTRQKCILKYRLHINNDWQTIEGIGYGPTEADACVQALDQHRGHIMEEAPSSVHADSQMVCSDLPDIRVHPVRIGDIVWESETDLHTYVPERKYFWYKRTQCRMFVERDSRNQNLMLYQGVVCRLSTTPNSKWRVIDKY